MGMFVSIILSMIAIVLMDIDEEKYENVCEYCIFGALVWAVGYYIFYMEFVL